MKPITNLLKGVKNGRKAGPFSWLEEAEQAIRRLCDAFIMAPLLRHYTPGLLT
jgi:hypothetical protein